MWSDTLSEPGVIPEIIFSVFVLLLLISGLIVRRRATRQRLFQYGTAWVLIAAVLLMGYGLKDQGAYLWRILRAEILPQSGLSGDGSISFRARTDGHFSVKAQVNGTTVVFLVDSGASDVILSPQDAARLGFDAKALSFDKPYRTANGLVQGAPVRLTRVEIGPIALDDVRASINGAPMETSLLGMSFLSRLSSWQVEGDRLTLSR
jgi:aspartyl protease family protein